MSLENCSKNLRGRTAADVTQVVYDSGVCFAALYDFVTYLADLQTGEFYYLYDRVSNDQEGKVLVRKLRPEHIDAIRENLGGNNMGEGLAELQAYEKRTEGDHRFACDYRPEELHLLFDAGTKFSVKIDRSAERLPKHLEPVSNPFHDLPPEFFPSREKMYPGDAPLYK